MGKIGRASYEFENMPSIISSYAIVGSKEFEGPLGKYFDGHISDSRFGEKSWEKAESKMQAHAMNGALKKAGLFESDIDIICGGDLLNQCIGSAYGLRDCRIPFLGLYGACSTMAESIITASISVGLGLAKKSIAVTSSHYCTAERQFRFPLEYGGLRAPCSQWTVTGSGALIIANSTVKGCPKIKRISVGKIVDLGIKDAANMGAAMAPAACDTLYNYFIDTQTSPLDYDLIVTGDLGTIGAELLKELLLKQSFCFNGNYNDCGLMIFDTNTQKVNSGGSGCGCSASVLCGYIIPAITKKQYKNILFCATGALMSTLSSQQGESIPGICHIVNIVSEK